MKKWRAALGPEVSGWLAAPPLPSSPAGTREGAEPTQVGGRGLREFEGVVTEQARTPLVCSLLILNGAHRLCREEGERGCRHLLRHLLWHQCPESVC